MAQSYGSGIVAGPYLWMAFGSGAVLIFGYLGWLLWDRIRLQRVLAAIRTDDKHKG